MFGMKTDTPTPTIAMPLDVSDARDRWIVAAGEAERLAHAYREDRDASLLQRQLAAEEDALELPMSTYNRSMILAHAPELDKLRAKIRAIEKRDPEREQAIARAEYEARRLRAVVIATRKRWSATIAAERKERLASIVETLYDELDGFADDIAAVATLLPGFEALCPEEAMLRVLLKPAVELVGADHREAPAVQSQHAEFVRLSIASKRRDARRRELLDAVVAPTEKQVTRLLHQQEVSEQQAREAKGERAWTRWEREQREQRLDAEWERQRALEAQADALKLSDFIE